MDFIIFLCTKIKNITLLSIIIVVFLLISNFFSNGYIVEKISVLQEKHSVNSEFCDYKFHLIDDTIVLNRFIFERGFGRCVKEKLEDKNIKVKKVILQDVYGGDVTEARIFAKYIRENQIPVLVKGVCNSACVDVFLHSPSRHICYDGKLGIHAYKAENGSSSFFVEYYRKLKQNSMLNAFKNTSINTDYIKELYDNVSHEDLYNPSLKELKENNLIHKEIPCS
jgi:hypothetical protein